MGADALSQLPLLNPEGLVSVRQAEERFEDAYFFYPVQNYMNEVYPLSYSAIETAQNNDNARSSDYSYLKTSKVSKTSNGLF